MFGTIPKGLKEYEVVVSKFDYFFAKKHVTSTHYYLATNATEAKGIAQFAHGDTAEIVSVTEEI